MTIELVGGSSKKGSACPFAWGIVVVQGPLGSPQPQPLQFECSKQQCMAWDGEGCSMIGRKQKPVAAGEQQ